MNSRSLTIIAWSYGLAGVGYAIYALRLWVISRPDRQGKAGLWLLAAVMITAVWGITGLAFSYTESSDLIALGLLFDMLRYAAWSAFILVLIRPRANTDTAVAASPTATMTIIAVLLLVTGVLVNLAIMLDLKFGGNLPQVASLHMLAMIVFVLVLLEQLFRGVTSDSRWSAKPLCLGLASALLYDLLLFADTVLFKQFDADAYSVRGFVHASIIPLLAVSSTRVRDWLAKMRLSQKAVFHSASLVMVGGYLVFMAAVGYYVRSFGGDWGRALQLAILFVASLGLGVLVLSGSMRAKLRVLVGKHFFSYRYDYREEWLRFTQTLSAQNSPAAMGEQVIRGLADLVESPSGVLWLKDSSKPSYSQASRWNLPAITETESATSDLCTFMLNSGWVVNIEEFRSFPRRYDDLRLPEWLSQIPNAWLIVPLMGGGAMTGFVILGSARTSMDVDWEINDLLRTAGRQAASFLAQMQATETLLEVRKFDAFNRMSAFVVHDLKNIVTQLSLMLKNAERHSEKLEFRQDMLMTVGHSVERMRQLMLQLREGATPPGTPIGVDLARIIERICASKTAQGRRVDIQTEDRLMTRGHEERIERVIGHLVQNALDATESGGRIWVKLERHGGQARIEVGDTGKGMSAEFVKDRLFKPFQTTKPAGMGIGAYESFQYVQELGGKMTADSEINAGTRIAMLLPLFEVSAGSDLRQQEAA